MPRDADPYPLRAARVLALRSTLTWLESERYETTEAIRWKAYDRCRLRERHVRRVAAMAAPWHESAALTQAMRPRGV